MNDKAEAAGMGNLPDFVSEYKVNTMEFEKCLILAKWGEFHFARGLSRQNEYSLRSYNNGEATRGRYMSAIGGTRRETTRLGFHP